MNILRHLTPEQLRDLSDKFRKYYPCLICKPAYTPDQKELWMEFVGECKKDVNLCYFTLCSMTDSLMMAATDINHRYIIFPSYSNANKEKDCMVHGYTEREDLSLEWRLFDVAIDTMVAHIIVKDSKTKEKYLIPLTHYKTELLIAFISQLRRITPDTLHTTASLNDI